MPHQPPPWEKGHAALAIKYGPDWQQVLAAKMRAVLNAKSEEERKAVNRARGIKAAQTTRERYGDGWFREQAKRLREKPGGWGAVERKYGPNWRSIVARKSAQAQLAKVIEKYGPIEGPRRYMHKAFSKAPPPPWRLSPCFAQGFTKEQRALGTFHSVVKRAGKGQVSRDLADAVIAAVPRRRVAPFEDVWNTVRADYDEAIAADSVTRALTLLTRLRYVEAVGYSENSKAGRRVVDQEENGYRRLK